MVNVCDNRNIFDFLHKSILKTGRTRYIFSRIISKNYYGGHITQQMMLYRALFIIKGKGGILILRKYEKKLRPQASMSRVIRSGPDSSSTFIPFTVKVFVQAGNNHFFLS
jgi:hypothetical protein